MKKISYIGFWEGFDKINNFITNNLSHIPVELSLDTDFLFVGNFTNYEDFKKINNISLQKKFLKKILVITEPISDMYENVYDLYKKNYFHLTVFCINESQKSYRYPFYMLYRSGTKFQDVNKICANMQSDEFEKKKFCAMINRHDIGKTRVPMYNSLKNIDMIECPSMLLNNCSNEYLNKVGKVMYLSEFVFNICPENFNTKLDGYVTEKIYEACMAGCIPIYYGRFDETEHMLFNKERIIFYDPFDEQSVESAKNKITTLWKDRDKLLEFYHQPVFVDGADDYIQKLHVSFFDKLDKYIRYN